jgi:hypothetical protein
MLISIRVAELYLLEKAQKGLMFKGAKMLTTYVLMEEDILRMNASSSLLGRGEATRSQGFAAW